jgi:hypothetical protein
MRSDISADEFSSDLEADVADIGKPERGTRLVVVRIFESAVSNSCSAKIVAAGGRRRSAS